MSVNPYSFKDQASQEWQLKQRELAGKGLTDGTIFDPKPASGSWNVGTPAFGWTPPVIVSPGSGAGGDINPVAAFLVLLFAVTSIPVGLGAWALGYPDPLMQGLGAGVYVLRIIGTVVLVIVMQFMVLCQETVISAVYSPWGTTLLDWVFAQTGWMLLGAAGGVIAAWFGIFAIIALTWRAMPLAGKLVCFGGAVILFCVFLLPTHIELSKEGWRVLKKDFGWVMVL